MQQDKLETTDHRYASQQIRQPPTESRFRQNNVIELYIKQSLHIQQMNLQHSKKISAPARQSPWRPLPSSRTTVAAARPASSPAQVVNAGCKGTTLVPVQLPLQQTDGGKKSHIHQVLCQKKASHNISYI
jgi:hypothetical protein